MIGKDIRVPGSYTEVDASGANGALPAYRQAILVVAPRIKTPAAWITATAYALGAVVKPTANALNYYICIVAGTSGGTQPVWPGAGGSIVDGTATWREFCTASDIIAVNTPTRCFSADEAAKYCGSGSVAHRMVMAAFEANRFTEVSVVLVDDADAGVKATGSLAITGTSTVSGTIDFYIGGNRLTVTYSAGATAASIAAELDALIASYHNLPFTSDVATGTVTLRAKNAGTVGNLIGRYSVDSSKHEPVVVKSPADGISVAVIGFSGGATDSDLTNAFTAATNEHYALVTMPYTGADQIADLKTYLNSVSSEIAFKGARGFVGVTSTIAAATTLADVNHERIHVVLLRKCRAPAYELAAMVTADHGATGHAALPLNGREIPIDAPAIVDRLEFLEINALLWNGVAPYNADGNGVVRCVRSITTYQTNAAGSPDPLYLDTTTIANLDYFRTALKTRHELEFQGKALRENHVQGEPDFIVTPSDIRTVNIDLALRCELNGNVQNVKLLKDRFLSVRDPDVQGRVNSDIPVEVVQGLHVLANTIRVVTTN